MQPFPYPTYRGAKIQISLKADADDYNRLKVLGKESGLNQSLVVHLLLELMRLRLVAEQYRGNRVVDEFGSPLESYIWLAALDAELVDQEEMQAAAWTASHVSANTPFSGRIGGLFELLQQRFAERYGPGPDLSEEYEPAEEVKD